MAVFLGHENRFLALKLVKHPPTIPELLAPKSAVPAQHALPRQLLQFVECCTAGSRSSGIAM